MRTTLRITFAALAVALCTAAAKPSSSDEQVADAVAKYATNLLAADKNDSNGVRLLGLAGKLDPENETMLLTTGMHKRGLVIQSVDALPEKSIVYGLKLRASALLGDRYKTNKTAMQKGALFASAALLLEPSSSDLVLLITKAEARGIESDFDKLLNVKYKAPKAVAPVRDQRTAVTAPVNKKIPEDAVEFEGHHYKVYDDAVSSDDAERKCKKLGGYLVTLTTDAESRFVTGVLISTGVRRPPYFTGATRKSASKSWTWRNGEKFDYNNWGANTVAGLDGTLARDGQWWVVFDSKKASYICEWK